MSETTSKAIEVLVVGRHVTDFGNRTEEFKVVEVRNVTFPATAEECEQVLWGLWRDAKAQGARVLLQNTPGQVTAALVNMALRAGESFSLNYGLGFGVVISIPSQTEPGYARCPLVFSEEQQTWEAVAFANPRTKWEEREDGGFTLLAEKPRPFVFQDVLWF